MAEKALQDVVVVERAGRLAGAIAATLLAELGATVVRVESPGFANPHEPARWREHPLSLAGKTRLTLDPATPGDAAALAALEARADIVVASMPDGRDADPDGPIRCEITAYGRDAGAEWPADAGEVVLQASAGLMAATGDQGGPPEFVHAPFLETFAGVNAATAILAALRLREDGGPAQRIDMAVHDAGTALMGTFVGDLAAGGSKVYRAGSAHHLCAPWDAYPTADGAVLLCSNTEGQWQRLLDLMGRGALKDDPRFKGMAARLKNRGEVDALVSGWTAERTTDDVLRAIGGIDVPIGPIMTVGQLPKGDVEVPGLPTRQVAMPDGQMVSAPLSPLALTLTPGVAATRATAPEVDAAAVLARLGPAPVRPKAGPARMPLAGVRVVEIGAYTAGPTAGRFLANLGAEVIKVEPPEGESSRPWAPQYDGVSGYFATYNAGKKFVTLDLRKPEDKAALWDLLATSQALVQNLKPGALGRLGFGEDDVIGRFPAFVYGSISGYGAKGSQSPALDTVAQARSGMMSLTGSSRGGFVKAGYSCGDLMAGHMLPLMMLAALRHSRRTGRGQHCDYSMRDGLAWATQIAWPDGKDVLPPCCRLACKDGWVAAEAGESEARAALAGADPATLEREQAAARLRNAGIAAAAILDLHDVFALPLTRARRMIGKARTPGGEAATFMGTPYGLTVTPPLTEMIIGPAGADNDLLNRRQTA
ncbi:MAG: CoA transferase [Alphaproteobacteria bacterium]